MKFNTFDTETRASRREGRKGGREGGREDIAEERRARAKRKEIDEGVRAAETHNECHS